MASNEDLAHERHTDEKHFLRQNLIESLTKETIENNNYNLGCPKFIEADSQIVDGYAVSHYVPIDFALQLEDRFNKTRVKPGDVRQFHEFWFVFAAFHVQPDLAQSLDMYLPPLIPNQRPSGDLLYDIRDWRKKTLLPQEDWIDHSILAYFPQIRREGFVSWSPLAMMFRRRNYYTKNLGLVFILGQRISRKHTPLRELFDDEIYIATSWGYNPSIHNRADYERKVKEDFQASLNSYMDEIEKESEERFFLKSEEKRKRKLAQLQQWELAYIKYATGLSDEALSSILFQRYGIEISSQAVGKQIKSALAELNLKIPN